MGPLGPSIAARNRGIVAGYSGPRGRRIGRCCSRYRRHRIRLPRKRLFDAQAHDITDGPDARLQKRSEAKLGGLALPLAEPAY
jgi:hypothetical protein